MNGLLLLGICVILSVAASMLLKVAVTSSTANLGFSNMIANPYIWAGATFYASAFLCYIFVLRHVPLSIAQPTLTAGVSALTAILAVLILREPMGAMNWAGIALICIGVSMLFWETT